MPEIPAPTMSTSTCSVSGTVFGAMLAPPEVGLRCQLTHGNLLQVGLASLVRMASPGAHAHDRVTATLPLRGRGMGGRSERRRVRPLPAAVPVGPRRHG